MGNIFIQGLMIFLLIIDEHGNGTEHGSGGIKEYVMHHVNDQIIYPLHIGNFDISITKHVLMLWIAAAILIIFIPLAFRSKSLIPKGPANLIEAIVVYLKETIIDPNLGSEASKYGPYLLTAFFFIITCNLLGLIPMGSTATGNISVTVSMAL